MTSLLKDKIKKLTGSTRIIDLGGGGGFKKELSKFKNYFREGSYKSLDFDASTNPDIVGDIQNLPIRNGEYDAVLCVSVLEHVPEPHKAVSEIYRILKKGGIAYLYIPFLFPYHASQGHYKDYFRFTKDGVRYLCRDFDTIEIRPTRMFFEMWFNMLPKINKYLTPLGILLDKLFYKQKGNQVSGYEVFLVK